MKKIVKIGIGVAAGLAVLVGGAALYAQLASERKLHRIVSIDVRPVSLPEDAVALERGRYLYATRGCTDCHGRDGAGKVFIDDPNGLHVKGPNITLGQGSPTAAYAPADWVRAIRHGLNRNGQPLLIMPSEDYTRMTDADLGALIAYVRALPPVTDDRREIRLPLPVRFVYAAGILMDAAEKIDHSLPPAQPVAGDDVIAQGAYVANMCQGCHGEGLRGGKIPGTPPDWPAAADLRPGPVMARYTTPESFAAMLRSGKRPDGSAIKVMPFDSLQEMSDAEIAALLAYLKTLPGKAR
jgi:mono/diheme cytochrome c family protein